MADLEGLPPDLDDDPYLMGFPEKFEVDAYWLLVVLRAKHAYNEKYSQNHLFGAKTSSEMDEFIGQLTQVWGVSVDKIAHVLGFEEPRVQHISNMVEYLTKRGIKVKQGRITIDLRTGAQART